MKTFKYLPLVAALALVACGEKAPATAETGANKATPATAASSAPAPAAAESTPASGTTATSTPPVASAEATAAAPAASTAAAPAATASAGDLAKGEKVYTATCLACHGAGVMGAPKFGDKAAWGPRIAKGKDALYTSAINGVRMMPPKGGNPGLKDEELKAAVDYMVSKSS